MMTRRLPSAACFAVLFSGATVISASAAVVLRYDSSTSDSSQLSIVGTTDAAFISAADAATSIDNVTVASGYHGTQTQVQGDLGTEPDLTFRFGGNGSTISYALTPENALTGSWIGTSFTAAQDLIFDQLSFNLFVNSQNGSTYAARDVGLFASLDGGSSFIQFGDLMTGATGNGNQGVITFSDSLFIGSGEEVELRLLFTDKTNPSSNLQSSTRIGDVQISASVPEPSSIVLFGLGGAFALIQRKRA
ncbi:MAG: PEP-CTERM sorting domain-containing protein [Verrucomicrobiales bacterium]